MNKGVQTALILAALIGVGWMWETGRREMRRGWAL